MLGLRRTTVVAAFVLAPILLLVAGIGLYDRGGSEGASTPAAVAAGSVADSPGSTDLSATIASLQERLRSLPEDYGSWNALGFAYISQARATADPSYYPKADEAFALVLTPQPENVAGLTGQGALANARHAFADGRGLAQRAVDLDAFNATAKGVLVDSLLELGEYDAALGVLQEMVDLKPGVASFTRVSYSYELRGDVEGATYALTRALEVAQSAPDIAFVQLQLGDLAYGTGDYATAGSHYADGLRGDPANVPLLAGQARVSAAVGDVDAALAGFAAVVQRLPQLTYLVEHGELLDSVGRADEAQAQYDVVDVEQTLSGAAGVQTDIEVALYDADHGSPADALRVAEAQYATRRSVQVEDALAWALHANGRSAEALPHALAAQQLGTRNALWDYHRGMIQLALGLTDDARASLTAALELHPAFSALHAPLARTALNGLGAGPVDDAVDGPVDDAVDGPVDGGVDGPVDGAVVAP